MLTHSRFVVLSFVFALYIGIYIYIIIVFAGGRERGGEVSFLSSMVFGGGGLFKDFGGGLEGERRKGRGDGIEVGRRGVGWNGMEGGRG